MVLELCFLLAAPAGNFDEWVQGMRAVHALEVRGENAAAEQMLRKLVRQAESPGYEQAYPFALHGLAFVIHQQTRFDEAEPLYRRVLARTQAGSELHIRTLNNLTSLYLSAGRPGDAGRTLRRLAGLPLARYPREKALYSVNAAELLRSRGKPAEAAKILREALTEAEAALGSSNRFIGGLLNSLGLALWADGRPSEAAPLFERAYSTAAAALGPGHRGAAYILVNLANAYLSSGDFVRAEEAAGRAVTALEARPEPDPGGLAMALLARAGALRKLHRGREAKGIEKRARGLLASLRETPGNGATVDVSAFR